MAYEIERRYPAQRKKFDSILDTLAEGVFRGRVPLHRVPQEIEKRFEQGKVRAYTSAFTEKEIASFYQYFAGEVLRRGVEKHMEASGNGVRLEYLRDSAHWDLASESGKPEYVQYIGGDRVTIAGPVSIEVEVNENGRRVSGFGASEFIPMCNFRGGVTEGVSFGIRMIKKLVDYGSSGTVKIYAERDSVATRSPTFRFENFEDADAARRAITSAEFLSDIYDAANRILSQKGGVLGDMTCSYAKNGEGHELSVNFIYRMGGDFYGHEIATYATGILLRNFLTARLDAKKIPYRSLWLAGGEDGDMAVSDKSIRGRKVKAAVFLPESYILHEVSGKGGYGGAEDMHIMSYSKNHLWRERLGAGAHMCGMEPEIIAGVMAAVAGSPPVLSSSCVTDAEPYKMKGTEGIMYSVTLTNFEWGSEGLDSPTRKECEAIMGLRRDMAPGSNSIRVAAFTAAAALAGGLNQHRLAYNDGLANTKEKLI
jgi:hypothetical protein